MADEKRPVTANKPTNDIVAQVAERVRTGDNVLIALSKDPSVDELAAAIGLTFVLDKMGKHATAIFSGAVPNAIEFLEPEKTFETNTNSLQDFIIALDKDKADHLRYKIDGDYVKVYITPYKTTIDEGDLEFSHGDFNVDLVIALGVGSAEDLDKALAEYGRIMHDASSINIGVEAPGQFGDLKWSNPAASAVSEMVCELAERLKDKESLLDKPIATALLAGIVAATSRFSNERTTPETMSVASKLMEAGADQQLISSSIPVDGELKVADADTGMPVEGESGVEEEPKAVEAPKVEEEPAVEEVDATKLQVQHGEPVADEPKVEELPAESAPVEAVATDETPEQQLEKIIQTQPAGENKEPLMDELREAAEQAAAEPEHEEKVLEPLGETEREPEKDYASLMDQELGANAAAQAAPSVPGTAEINGIPPIDYSQGGDGGQVISAPTMGAEAAAVVTPVAAPAVTPVEVPAVVPEAPVVPVVEPVQAAQVEAVAPVEPAAPAEPVVPVVPPVAEPVANPLPMPGVSAEFLPPPPPPFDPSATMGAVDFSPTPAAAPVVPAAELAVPAAPAPAVEPIVPAAPETEPEVEHAYLGANPVMQDQVYPSESSDPGAFQLPKPAT